MYTKPTLTRIGSLAEITKWFGDSPAPDVVYGTPLEGTGSMNGGVVPVN